MIVYNIYENRSELRLSKDSPYLWQTLKEGVTEDCSEPLLYNKTPFTSKEEAINELDTLCGSTIWYRGTSGEYADVTEYSLNEEEIDEDGNLEYAETVKYSRNDFYEQTLSNAIINALDDVYYPFNLPFSININKYPSFDIKDVTAVIENKYNPDTKYYDVIVNIYDANFKETDYSPNRFDNCISLLTREYKVTGNIDYGEVIDTVKFDAEYNVADMVRLALIQKQIATKILSTESAYQMVEYKGKIFISAYDTFDNKDEFLEALKECRLPDGNFDNRYDFTIYDNYPEIVTGEYKQVLDDINDLGLWHDDKWDFYLTRDELESMGISKEFIDHTLAVEKDLDMENDEIEMGG